MRAIQSIGTYLTQDENGFVVNDLSINKVGKPWRDVAYYLAKAYQNELGEYLHSVYIRGSVARGLAVEDISDIDMFALVKPSFSETSIRWQSADFQRKYERIVTSKFPFVTNIEMMMATYNADFKTSKLAMITKTQSLLLVGQNIFSELAVYRPNESMCLNYRWLATDIETFIKIKPVNFTLNNCSEIMKLLLRTGFELVINRIGKFSPDLYICYRDFSVYYPNKSTEMRQVLHWFLNPILDKNQLDAFINSFGNWILYQVRKTYLII